MPKLWPVVSDENPLDGFVKNDASRNFRPLVGRVTVSEEGKVLLDPQRLDLFLNRVQNRVPDLSLRPAGKRDPIKKLNRCFQIIQQSSNTK